MKLYVWENSCCAIAESEQHAKAMILAKLQYRLNVWKTLDEKPPKVHELTEPDAFLFFCAKKVNDGSTEHI